MSSRDRRIGQLEAEVADLKAAVASLIGRVNSLETENRELRAENRELKEAHSALKEENRELKTKLGQNSSNSSKPPSSDPPGAPRELKKPTGRKPGGQPGHEKRARELVPFDQVSRVVDVMPERCGGCSARLSGRDATPARHQVVELPPVTALVTEYRCHSLSCRCGATTRAELPPEASRVFGERLSAFVCVLMGQYRLSKRMVQRLLGDVLGIKVSLGMVPKLGAEMAEALADPVAEAESFIRKQDSVHGDETGWYEGKANGRHRRVWLWTFAAPQVAVFRIEASRGTRVAQSMLGLDFTGFLCTDRWSAYNWLDVGLRQICWSHLKRDFMGFVDRGGRGAHFGKLLLAETRKLFRLHHRARDGTLRWKSFERKMRNVERAVGRLLRKAAVCAEAKTAGIAREILLVEPALWTFVQMPNVDPTNNFAERCIRHAVMYRKTSFGTQSTIGSRFVERILTAITSLNLQKRNVLEYLTDALRAHRRGDGRPSLLPLTSARLAIAA